MKKSLLFVAAIAIVCAFSACQKEGVYHPKKKISKVHEQSGSGVKNYIETWTWDGNNLTKISKPDKTYFRTFKYEKNRISKITWSDGEYFSFFFDGNFIKKIEYYAENGVLKASYNIKHTKNKVTSVIKENYDDSKNSNKKDIAATLRLFLPVAMEEESDLNKKRPELAKGETFITTYEYTWDGNNVKSNTITQTIGDTYSYTNETTYKYDKKQNPYYYFFDNMTNSKNNVISSESVVVERLGSSTTSGTYTYEYDIIYDGKWPTEILSMYRSGSYTYHYTTFYTYED